MKRSTHSKLNHAKKQMLTGSGQLTMKKRGRDDKQIEHDRQVVFQKRKESRYLQTGK